MPRVASKSPEATRSQKTFFPTRFGGSMALTSDVADVLVQSELKREENQVIISQVLSAWLKSQRNIFKSNSSGETTDLCSRFTFICLVSEHGSPFFNPARHVSAIDIFEVTLVGNDRCRTRLLSSLRQNPRSLIVNVITLGSS